MKQIYCKSFNHFEIIFNNSILCKLTSVIILLNSILKFLVFIYFLKISFYFFYFFNSMYKISLWSLISYRKEVIDENYLCEVSFLKPK
jgi:hypothetical protein